MGKNRRWPGVPRLSQNSERSHELLRKQKIVVKRDFLLSGTYKGREEICRGLFARHPLSAFGTETIDSLNFYREICHFLERKKEKMESASKDPIFLPSSSSSFFSAPVPLRFSIACLGQINSAVFVSRERKSWRVDIETRYR